MKARAFFKTIQMETVLYIRSFFGPFFSLAFPILMVCIFGGIYGNEPAAMFGGRGAMDVSIPAYLGMVIAVGGVMTLPLALIEYQASSAYKRFDATPVGKETVVASQVLVYFTACVLSSVILVIFGRLAYGVRIGGSWHVIVPVFALSLACLFSLGFLISALFKDTKLSQLASYLLYFVMLFCSGATLPIELFPEGMKIAAEFLPLTHAVKVLRAAFAGESLSGHVLSLVILAVLTAVCGGAGLVLFRRRKWA